MNNPAFKVTSICGHTNLYINPLPKPGEIVYCYRCVDWQSVVKVDFPAELFRTARGRTSCKREHPFNEQNTYTAKDGRHLCRICRNLTKKKRREKAKE